MNRKPELSFVGFINRQIIGAVDKLGLTIGGEGNAFGALGNTLFYKGKFSRGKVIEGALDCGGSA